MSIWNNQYLIIKVKYNVYAYKTCLSEQICLWWKTPSDNGSSRDVFCTWDTGPGQEIYV